MPESGRQTLSPGDRRNAHPQSWRGRLHELIFESSTAAGRAFDVILIWAILLSVAVVMLESIRSLRADWGEILFAAEWMFTLLFSIELLLRMISLRKPALYLFSFYGIVDILAILPTYLSLLIPGTQYLLVIRILRLLRVFRIFRLTEFIGEAAIIRRALGGDGLHAHGADPGGDHGQSDVCH